MILTIKSGSVIICGKEAEKMKAKTKAKIGAALLSVVMLTGLFAAGAQAAGVSEITATISPNIKVQVDGTNRDFYDAGGTQVFPVVYNGTTYLPVRAIGELMGKNVNWDQATLTVTLSSPRTAGSVQGTPNPSAQGQMVSAQLRPDFTIVVDGIVRSFQDVNGNRVYPLLYSGTNYLPIRAIGELMGKTVSWNQEWQMVILGGGTGGLVTDADTFDQGGSQGGTANGGTQGQLIGEERAKSIALNHAGLTAAQVTFIKAIQDWENGRQVYEVEFYVTSTYAEYDYEIDAYTGEIVGFDYDAEDYRPPVGGNDSTGSAYIGEAKAKSIAVSQVKGATVSNVRWKKVKLDFDDGRWEYDVEFIYGSYEYEFEIDAYSGKILSRDIDSIYD